jgi:transposase InsO family protein
MEVLLSLPGTIHSCSSRPVTSKQLLVKALPDSGAMQSVIAHDLADRLNLEIDRTRRPALRAANASAIDCRGTASLEMHYEGATHTLEVLVSRDIIGEFIVGWQDLIAFGVLRPDFPTPLTDASSSSHTTHPGSPPADKRPADPQGITDTIQYTALSSPIREGIDKLVATYSDVVRDFRDGTSLPAMGGPAMHIHIRTDTPIKPKKVLVARAVPIHMQDEANKLVQTAIESGIITPEPLPSDWCSPSFFVRDPSKDGKLGKVRLVTDFSALNEYIRRPVHPFPSSAEMIAKIDPKSRIFARLDCTKSYFQVRLDDESSRLTTMILPQGRFRYLRAPMGLSASSDEWNRRSDEALSGLPGCTKLVDDVLVQAASLPELMHRLEAVLVRCRRFGITISKSKILVGNKIKFAGFVISPEGIYPDPDKLAALRDFPSPTNISELRAFHGLANQLAPFVPDLAHLQAPLRPLLKKGTVFNWLSEHETAFQLVKQVLVEYCSKIQTFDPDKETVLLTDASRLKGIGFALIQKDSDGKIALIQCASRSLDGAESRYSTIELEALAIIWAIKKSKFYLYGCPKPFQVITDHRPLIGAFKKPMEENSNRLRRFREQVCDYPFTLTWVEGKNHLIADALSRAPHFEPPEEGEADQVNLVSLYGCRLTQDPAFGRLISHAKEDPDYQAILDAITSDKRCQDLPPTHPARAFSNVWDELAIQDGLITRNDRIVVPAKERPFILDLLHLPHSGLRKTLQNARQLYFWPDMTVDVKAKVEQCHACLEHGASKPLGRLSPSSASAPWEKVSSDLFEFKGETFLLVVDRFSGFPFSLALRSQSARAVLGQLEKLFAIFGYPRIIRTDSGPCYRSEFTAWCEGKGIKHEISDPYHPEGNGLAENAVKSIKQLLEKNGHHGATFYRSLLEWRNAPRTDGFSPAQMFFGRRCRTELPALPQAYEEVDKAHARQERQEKTQARFDRHNRRRPPQAPFTPGQPVLIQDPRNKRWDTRGVIQGQNENPDSYQILSGKRVFIRNRCHLKPDTAMRLSPPFIPVSGGNPEPRGNDQGAPISSRTRSKAATSD